MFDKEVKHRTFRETLVRLMLGENMSRRARLWQQVGLVAMAFGLLIDRLLQWDSQITRLRQLFRH
jgi:hypothetical protein